jgi:hypothetical protein
MNRKEREQRKATARQFREEFVCSNCKELTQDGHFVPPSFGDPGFYICKRATSSEHREEK